jgi:hypothetical protein
MLVFLSVIRFPELFARPLVSLAGPPGVGGAEDVSGRAFMSAWSALKSLFAPCGIPLDEIALK